MNAIIGLTYLLLRDTADPRVSAQLEKVLGAAGQLQTLLEDILALSRIESGPVQLEQTEFTAEQVLSAVVAMVSTPAAAKALRLETELAANVPRILVGDPNRLRQVLLNFATNAVKFTDQGEVRFSVTVTEVRQDAVILRFTVADTGIGLSEEQLARLFQPFEQLESGASRRFGGTGLGLALCRRVAELMGGQVGVASRVGQGSTFWFEAPFGVGARDATAVPDGLDRAAALAAGFVAGTGRRVLLADDNETNLEVAAALLRMQGYEAELARDGSEAVTSAGRGTFAAILLDLQMPRQDGLEAARVIRAMPRHAATPILAMTASVFEEDREACLAAGMNDLVAKPIDPKHLAAVMQRWAPLAAAAPPGDGVADAASGRPAPGTPPLSDAREQLLQLRRLVEMDDLAARDLFHALAPEAAGSRHRELGRLLEAFDYEQAGVVLADLLGPD